eukprot:scaffold810_cov355-Pavlova_lutheri.AAC.31
MSIATKRAFHGGPQSTAGQTLVHSRPCTVPPSSAEVVPSSPSRSSCELGGTLVASLGSNINRSPELGRKDSPNLVKRTVQVVSEGIR